ncbi:MAG TPA: TetR/AcrR family transcriptional regulator [Haliangiales bacterium]|nr:TetR/AcrR family transcriptional regulator [Haliangiales bacterium]
MKTPTANGPRERLLEAARELTYTHGVAIGVDAILAKARVARRSLYQHFGGKDGLIAQVLHMTAAADLQRYQAALDSGGDHPRQRLLAMFDAFEAKVSAAGFRGCRYAAADLALPDRNHPAHAETRAYRKGLHRLLEHELERLGRTDAAFAADKLLLLLEGALAAAATRPETYPARAARAMAVQVIDG